MNRFYVYLKFIFSILLIFSGALFFSQEDNKTIINIENANNTRYEKDKQTDHDMIILSGEVRLSVAKGSDKNVILADIIRYDRTADMIYAEGNVSLEQTTASAGSQTVTASALMFNTSTLEGIFDDGRAVQKESDAINLPSGSTLIVASNIFGRSESNTIAFKDGVLTFCDDENPHWNIRASRIWLLPGGEFAFLNALVFVGPIPALYLPAFYYPKDELIFNPVFGSRKREGYFIQTTAYVYGRKPLDTSSSSSSSSSTTTDSEASERLKALFNFVKPSKLKDQKIEGIMLHNLDTDYKGNTSDYVKIMGDYYSNLGFMVGLDGVVRPKKYITNIEAYAKLGFSNAVFQKDAKTYMPYGPSGQKYYENSNLVGVELPFRYAAGIKMSMSNPFSLSLSLPVYSDPFFNDDFSEREETMDWISYLIDSAGDKDETETITEVSSFKWSLSSSYNIPLPQIIKPYLNSFSFSLNSDVDFSTMSVSDTRKQDENGQWKVEKPAFDTTDIDEKDVEEWKKQTPQRKFYYPSQVTPITLNVTLSGTFFDYSSTGTRSSASVKTPTFVSPLNLPEEFMTESEREAYLAAKEAEKAKVNGENGEITDEADSSKTENETDEENKTEEEKQLEFLGTDVFPKLTGVSDSVTKISGVAVSSKYSVKPSLSTQLAYPSSNLHRADDFDWGNLKSYMYTLKIPVTLDNSFSYGDSFISLSNSHTFNPILQEHPYISTDEENGGYTEAQATSLKKTDYSAEKRDWTTTNTISIKPFAYIPLIKETGVTWRNTVKVVRTEFLADKEDWEDNPEWDYIWAEWDDEDAVTTNALDFILAANQLDNKFSQKLTFTSTLKPQVEAYFVTFDLGFPFTNLSFDTGVKRKSLEDDEWVKQPFKQSLTLSFFNNSLKFSESYSYNREEEYHDSFKLSLGWKGLSFAYTQSYTIGYFMDYDEAGKPVGWKAEEDKEFLPYSLALSFSPGTKTIYTWKNRVSLGLGLSTSVTADLLKPTSSYFTFAPSISFKIHEFVTLTLTSTSRNSVIYRYFGNDIGLAGETNMFKDLMDSFRFDDDSIREGSGFKIQSMKFDVKHELHDWDFTMSFKIEPRLLQQGSKGYDASKGTKYYDFSPYITISILWRPMGAMKTEIIDKYGEWSLQ